MSQRRTGRKGTSREVIKQRCRKHSAPIFVGQKVQVEANKEEAMSEFMRPNGKTIIYTDPDRIFLDKGAIRFASLGRRCGLRKRTDAAIG
jgi:hypothetical protein